MTLPLAEIEIFPFVEDWTTFQGTFHIILWKEVYRGKTLRELKNEFLQTFAETLRNQLSLSRFYQKKSYMIIWLKFLFITLLKAQNLTCLLLRKRPLYLLKKFHWKFRINFRKIILTENNVLLQNSFTNVIAKAFTS